MYNANTILTCFSYFSGSLWPCFTSAKDHNIGDAYIRGICIRDWILISCGKIIACLYIAALVIIVIIIACVSYISYILYIIWGCWYSYFSKKYLF